MDKITLETQNKIRKFIKDYELTNIVLETGCENVYIPNENKFVVTKNFLSDTLNLFYGCYMLEKIDLQNFDFSEITTMSEWFYKCTSLTEIVFPTQSILVQVRDLWSCFSKTKLKIIDLSFCKFPKGWTVSLHDAFHRSEVEKIILPKCYVDKMDGCFYKCRQLTEIIAPIKIELTEEDFLLETFYDCNNLKLINLSDGKFSTKKFVSQINDPNNYNNLPEDCVIVVP